LTFVTDDCLAAFTPGSLIVDVSCDEGMGFTWARPTSFTHPTFTVGDNVHYYAVDHSPALPWDPATWEISEALRPHLRTVLAGPPAWDTDQTIRRAIEIRDGVIQDPTGKGRKRWITRWKAALNAFEITFEGRLAAARN
jgi:alanine dehydrogenase